MPQTEIVTVGTVGSKPTQNGGTRHWFRELEGSGRIFSTFDGQHAPEMVQGRRVLVSYDVTHGQGRDGQVATYYNIQQLAPADNGQASTMPQAGLPVEQQMPVPANGDARQNSIERQSCLKSAAEIVGALAGAGGVTDAEEILRLTAKLTLAFKWYCETGSFSLAPQDDIPF